MYIQKLEYQNFRNLENSTFTPINGVNIISGNNAQGKTNLLEAIWLFTGGHSFRGNKDVELTKLIDGKNCKNASLKANFFSQEREQWAKLNIENGRRNSVINGVAKKTGSALVGKICAVIFSPEHLGLVKDGPSGRRNFVDAAICQSKPTYTKTLAKYNRTIIQRNALLKQMQNAKDLAYMLDIWNEKAVSYGMEILKQRNIYLKKINEKAIDIYKGISNGKEDFEIFYNPFNVTLEKYLENPEKIYKSQLEKSFKSDLKLGQTTFGPHRDDIEIKINGLSARTYASQGQQRSAVITLKLSEAKMLEENIGESPIIILDDVMSELDKNRQDYILNSLCGRQIFISCCSEETVELSKKGKVFEIENGKIKM